ncbi:hypothetical protein CO709_19665 [Burkholderia thailandensis]|nr:hypothetical protein CO709_19665 [Burkholderia thailandensis]
MHRETNLQVENEETFEAQSARPKALLDSFQQRFLFARSRPRTRPSSLKPFVTPPSMAARLHRLAHAAAG